MNLTSNMPRRVLPLRTQKGISLTELLIAVSVLAIIGALAIPVISGVIRPSRNVMAQNLVESLNQGVHRFNQSNYELLFTAVAPSGQDEMLILRTMQFRDPNPLKAKVGSPYVKNNWNPGISSDVNDYRIVWMGNLFKLAPPGTTGTGIKLDFEGRDVTTPFVFPEGFNMAGK